MNRADRAVAHHFRRMSAALAGVPGAIGRVLDLVVQWLARRLVAATVAAQTGQSMVEYAVIIALIAVVSMGAIQLLGGGITTVFQNILVKIQGLGR